MDEQRPPRWTRWFVWTFLGSFLVCGATGLDTWSLTGFRLFSRVRVEHEVSREIVAVDALGREHQLRFARLPRAYQGSLTVVKAFGSLPTSGRVQVCQAWMDAAIRLGDRATSLRIYRGDRDPLPRKGQRPAAPVTKTLEYSCSSSPATERSNGAADATP